MICTHGIEPKGKCVECRRERHRRSDRKNRAKKKIRGLITRYPELYPLGDRCIFCGRTDNLEHGHLDYDYDGQNYLTVCHQCNTYMDKPITTKDTIHEPIPLVPFD